MLLFKKRPQRGPLLASLNITYRCNQSCSYCNTHNLKSSAKELDTKELYKLLKELKDLGVCFLSITGGEPLLRQDLQQVLKYAKKLKFIINLNTNGSMPEKLYRLAKHVDIDNICISIDSLQPDCYKNIKKQPIIIKQVLGSIKLLSKLRKRRSKRIMLRTILKPNNISMVESLIEYAEQNKLPLIIQPFHNLNKSSLHHSKQYISKDTSDKYVFQEIFLRLRKRYRFLRQFFYSHISDFLFNKNKLRKHFKCYCGFFNLKIDPYGNIYPCQHMSFYIDNAKNRSLQSILSSKSFIDFRKESKLKNCICYCYSPASILNLNLNRAVLKKV
ncbi:radical SAM protein [Candidatus Margulisiibacteriota bacterium]